MWQKQIRGTYWTLMKYVIFSYSKKITLPLKINLDMQNYAYIFLLIEFHSTDGLAMDC